MKLKAVPEYRDTIPAPPPTGPCGIDPTLCPGLEATIVDLGVMRADLERVKANVELILNEVRKISESLGIIPPSERKPRRRGTERTK
jgi:hypothetical protein